jgi:hypothetical protein
LPDLSRTALVVWTAAAAVTILPTWQLWRLEEDMEQSPVVGLVAMFDSGNAPVLSALRDDYSTIASAAQSWAVPTILVLVGLLACLWRSDPEAVGRRVAWGLVAMAAVGPLTTLYDDGPGFTIPIFTQRWLTTVIGSWGPDQLWYLVAALLVIAASHLTPRGVRPAPWPSLTGRRVAALLADYAIVSTAISLAAGDRFYKGLIDQGDLYVPESVAHMSVGFLYFWAQHALWGRTVGQRLLRLRVVFGSRRAGKAALRALVFPALVLVPEVGVLCLLVDGMWAFADPDGLVLHDRLAGSDVVLTGGELAAAVGRRR